MSRAGFRAAAWSWADHLGDGGTTGWLDWLRTLPAPPGQVYVVHGEISAADALRQRIEHGLGWRALVPEHGATWPV